MHHEWKASESKKARQNCFAREREGAAEKDQKCRSQMVIVDQNDSQRSSHAFAPAKEKLRGPDVTRDHRKHGDDYNAIVCGEMARSPNRESAFGKIAEKSQHEARPAQQPADIACADVAAAKIANILARAHQDQIITGRKTTQQVGAQPNPACPGPVSRVQLFHPRHFYINQLFSKIPPFRAEFTPICAQTWS